MVSRQRSYPMKRMFCSEHVLFLQKCLTSKANSSIQLRLNVSPQTDVLIFPCKQQVKEFYHCLVEKFLLIALRCKKQKLVLFTVPCYNTNMYNLYIKVYWSTIIVLIFKYCMVNLLKHRLRDIRSKGRGKKNSGTQKHVGDIREQDKERVSLPLSSLVFLSLVSKRLHSPLIVLFQCL